MANPAELFAEKAPVDYAAIAATVATMQPRALTPAQYEDVIQLIEWMQKMVVAQHARNSSLAAELDARSKELDARERTLRTKLLVVNAANSLQKVRKYFGR